ncbi:MAG: RNA 2',3'-cyclic phosphodiesterase [Candidatus Binatus sp.]|uniref:RNA 2',3'-cyclic phosphodiesterase n=1 Tax=Candidatus Binatus sp. TaxID=2811406 RepID=UPI0027258E98|nr:RNA 2',3'-cyclic phosphodiesterase [Candidatus Binatus sp.]MDO8432206.1 RNA 2',3'-cyclic phosphodiesterase [Candidatus Binatus sp.]
MVHWAEGHAREHARDDFPSHGHPGVRAFVAIRMGAQVEDSVAATIAELSRPRDGVRWVRRENLHVTLKFLGPSVDAHRLEHLTAALHDFALETDPFELAAEGVGAFPNLQRPRTIWVGLHSAELGALASRVEALSVECGFERDSRRWTGHLTIGRVRNLRGFSKTRQAILEMKDREFGSSRIESLTLYRSHPGKEAARHEALATYLFGKHGSTD